MMDLFHSLSGMLEVTIVCADPAHVMTMLEQNGIELRNVRIPDALTLVVLIRRRQWALLTSLCEKKGLDAKITGRKGFFWKINGLWHRPVLLIGILSMILLGMYLPSRILFVRVEGNTALPDNLIIETAADCGIRFGANRRQVRSEKMKNALLEAMPQLQWAGVNTRGCVAVISVRERQEQAAENKNTGVGSIVASRDGVITSITTTRGSGICKVGQAVKAGQVLISGYTDCGISIRADRAEGEVFAQTDRELLTICPTNCLQRSEIIGSEIKYSLIIGKKRINFYFSSGISGTSCVKMYEENFMTLPGGFQLPVILVKETWVHYETEDTFAQPEQAKLEAFSREYLKHQMVAGTILTENWELSEDEGQIILTGRFACQEMIGQFRKEEIVKPDGTND